MRHAFRNRLGRQQAEGCKRRAAGWCTAGRHHGDCALPNPCVAVINDCSSDLPYWVGQCQTAYSNRGSVPSGGGQSVPGAPRCVLCWWGAKAHPRLTRSCYSPPHSHCPSGAPDLPGAPNPRAGSPTVPRRSTRRCTRLPPTPLASAPTRTPLPAASAPASPWSSCQPGGGGPRPSAARLHPTTAPPSRPLLRRRPPLQRQPPPHLVRGKNLHSAGAGSTG